jgi:glucosamine-6-phosphate deaminase
MQIQPDSPEQRRRERIPTRIFSNSVDASKAVALEIADLIKEKAKIGKNAVLGLATGSTPTRVYDELVRMHKEDGLSFRNVVTFNLDEYFPIEPDALQSYVHFMNEHLFDHVDIKRENVHIPDGRLATSQVPSFCEYYEKEIDRAGGIDIQILGIGRTGHIGFNEPGSGSDSRTRMITLDRMTRIDAASDFFAEDNVPRRAITMGVGSIMGARRIILMAWGEGKSRVIQKTVETDVSDSVPATFLQRHFNTLFVLDEAAGAELTRIKTPWLIGQCDWTEQRVRGAVVWLCQQVKKPILKLHDEDYNEHGMGDLLTARGTAYDINIHVFNQLQRTISGWPGGKPNADDSNRPERAKPFPKRVVLFSPHPDDDVISMGGTFIRLADQGHEVHVAYQTSGNIAVFDDDAIRFADFVVDMNRHLGFNSKESEKFYKKVLDFLHNKKPGQIDSTEVQEIKALIRQGEAKAGCRASGVPDSNAHFLNMPFYQTGTIKKNPIGEEDIQLVMDLLNKIKPHQIYAAGDLSDPHGTHRVCLAAIMEAVKRIKASNAKWINDCWVWLYRGAWQEWGVDQIEMAVPLSPQEVMRKRKAIFKHQSQKDAAMFPGSDKREFWQRAEDRNRATAEIYDVLGLAEYEAIEGFVRWHF